MVISCLNRAIDPLIFGDYPPEMRRYHGSELPRFSPEETEYVKGSVDFLGINHYSTLYVKDCIYSTCISNASRAIRGFVYTTGERDGVPIGERVRKYAFGCDCSFIRSCYSFLLYNNVSLSCF